MASERLIPGTPEWRLHGHQHLQRYQFALLSTIGRRALDLACGVGYGSYVLSASGAQEVVGVDRDLGAIEYARRTYVRPGLRYEPGDASGWTYSGPPFDVVVSFETIEHLPNPAAFVRRLAGLLIPGGRLVISAPNTLHYQRGTPAVSNPYHLSEPDYATLTGWLAPHFEIESEWEQSPTLGMFDGRIPSLEADVRASRRYRWAHLFNSIEKAGRALAGRSLPVVTAPARRSDLLIAATTVLPLLPERRAACDVFLFVCRRKT